MKLRSLLLLEELERHDNVSQRRLADRLGIAVSHVNRMIRDLLDDGHIRVVDRGVRPYAYDLTTDGKDYCRRLSHEHYRSVLGDFRQVQERIRGRLAKIRTEGVRRLVLYGTGQVMEVTYPLARAQRLHVVGLVDDDAEKHGTTRGGLVVSPPSAIERLNPDCVLITTFRHADEIQDRIPERVRTRVRILEL